MLVWLVGEMVANMRMAQQNAIMQQLLMQNVMGKKVTKHLYEGHFNRRMKTTRGYFYWHVREPSPMEREVRMDTSTNYPSNRPDGNLSQEKISSKYVQEQEPQRSTSIYDRIGPSRPRNWPQQSLPVWRQQDMGRNKNLTTSGGQTAQKQVGKERCSKLEEPNMGFTTATLLSRGR